MGHEVPCRGLGSRFPVSEGFGGKRCRSAQVIAAEPCLQAKAMHQSVQMGETDENEPETKSNCAEAMGPKKSGLDNAKILM